jgi:hypothetical protein
MAIKPGTLNDFGGSMAEEIEAQLNATLLADGLPGLPMDDTPERRDRRRLFVAIARGVVRHLHLHEPDLKVGYFDNGIPHSTHVSMTTTGI